MKIYTHLQDNTLLIYKTTKFIPSSTAPAAVRAAAAGNASGRNHGPLPPPEVLEQERAADLQDLLACAPLHRRRLVYLRRGRLYCIQR